MHVGGVRTALFAWLVARQSNGQFLLRIEDTDRTRYVEESERHIMDCLSWLGLSWDEEPLRQSQRLDIYQEWANKLVETGRAYADPRSEQELEQLRAEATRQKKPISFKQNTAYEITKWQKDIPL